MGIRRENLRANFDHSLINPDALGVPTASTDVITRDKQAPNPPNAASGHYKIGHSVSYPSALGVLWCPKQHLPVNDCSVSSIPPVKHNSGQETRHVCACAFYLTLQSREN